MTNIVAESLTHADNGGGSLNSFDMNRKGWSFAGSLFTGTGVHGGGLYDKSLNFTGSLTFDLLFDPRGVTLSEVIAGYHFLPASTNLAYPSFMTLFDGSSQPLVHLDLSSTGVISAYRGSGTSNLLGSTGTGYFQDAVVHMLELRSKINASTGTVLVYYDGTLILNLTSQNTGSNPVRYVTFSTNGGSGGKIQDLYINDTNGSVNNDVLGDIRIEFVPIDTDGNYTQFSTHSNANHWDNVDEHPLSDTDYNFDTVVGHKDSYILSALQSSSGTIKCLNVCMDVAKFDTPARGVKSFVRSSGTDSGLSAEMLLPSDFSHRVLMNSFSTDPSTSAAWTISGVNSAEIGIDIST